MPDYGLTRDFIAVTPSGIVAIRSGSKTDPTTAISASIPQVLAITCSSNFNNRLTKLTTLNAFGVITLTSGSRNSNDNRIILRYIDSSSRGIIETIDDADLGNDGESVTKDLSFQGTGINDIIVDIPINNNDDSFLVAYRTVEALNNVSSFNSSFRATIVDDGSSLSSLTASIGNMTIGSGFKIRNSASLGTNSLTDGGEGKFTITSLNSGALALPDFSGTQVQVGGMMIGSSFKVGGSPDTFNFNIITSGSGKMNQRFYPGKLFLASASLVQRMDPDDKKSFEFLVPSQSVGGDDDLVPLYVSSSRRIGFATKDPLTDIDIRADEFQIKRRLEDKGLRVNPEGNIESFDKTPESAATGSEFILNYSRGISITAEFVNFIYGTSFSNDTDAQNFFNNLKPDDQSGGIAKGELAGFITPPQVGDTLGAIRWIAQSGSVGDLDERGAGETAVIKAVVSDGQSDGIEADLIFSVADRTGGSVQKLLLDADNQHELTGSLKLVGSIIISGLVQSANNSNTYIDFESPSDDNIQFRSNNVVTAQSKPSTFHINPINANVDFRVDGDSNDNLIFTDAGTEKVGIGTGTPSQKLTVEGNISASGDLSIQGFSSVSASLAAAGGGSADNLGNHTATQDLNMSGFNIDDTQHITASGEISASGNVSGLRGKFSNSVLTDRIINFAGNDTQFDFSTADSIQTSQNITSSGNISASGNIIGGIMTSQGNNVISQSGAFTNNEFIVAVGTSAVTSSDALAVDSDGNLGIGTPNPEVRLHMLGEDAQTTQILMEQFNDTSDAPDIRTRRYRGTSASRADVQTGDFLFRLNVHGQDGGSSELYGSMRFDVDSSDQDALEWGLQTRDTAGTVADRLIIDANGNFTASGEISSTINGGSF